MRRLPFLVRVEVIVTDIDDIKHEQRTISAWLMDMLKRNRDPIASLHEQLRPLTTDTELRKRLMRGVDDLILAAVPEENDTLHEAKLKRLFVQRTNRWKETWAK